MLQTILLGYEENILFEELIHEYKKTLKPNLLAYAFVKYYKTICKVTECYKLLHKEDCASFCLQELDSCMLNYSFDKSCSFITFFVACYKNRLRTEQEQLYTNIRYANYITEDLAKYENILTTLDEYDFVNLNKYNLTDKEKKHCELISLGYSNKEIAKILNVSIQYVSQLTANIRKKLSILTLKNE